MSGNDEKWLDDRSKSKRVKERERDDGLIFEKAQADEKSMPSIDYTCLVRPRPFFQLDRAIPAHHLRPIPSYIFFYFYSALCLAFIFSCSWKKNGEKEIENSTDVNPWCGVVDEQQKKNDDICYVENKNKRECLKN